MASDHSAAASDTELNLDTSTSYQPGSTPTPMTTVTQHLRTQPNQPFLPGNGPIHLAPSITHQPELLLLSRMFDIFFLLVTHILERPMFVDDNAFRLFHQYHHSVVDLGRATMRLMRARRLLQFVPGPPGLPSQYRMDPTAYFPPHTTDFLSTAPTTPPQSPARSHRRSSFPSSSFFSTTTATTRERSRSRDRPSS